MTGADGGDVARRAAGIHRDRRVEVSRLVRHALSKEDVTRSVDDGHVGHTVAVQVCDEGCVVRNQPARTGLGELTVSLVQLDCDGVGGLLTRSPGRMRPSPVKSPVATAGGLTLVSQVERGRTVEPSPAVALEQGNRVGGGIGDRQVKRTATKEMGSDDRGWSQTCPDEDRRQEIEGPRGRSEHNRNEIRPVGRTFTHDSEVVDSIAIEVSRRERYRKALRDSKRDL